MLETPMQLWRESFSINYITLNVMENLYCWKLKKKNPFGVSGKWDLKDLDLLSKGQKIANAGKDRKRKVHTLLVGKVY